MRMGSEIVIRKGALYTKADVEFMHSAGLFCYPSFRLFNRVLTSRPERPTLARSGTR